MRRAAKRDVSEPEIVRRQQFGASNPNFRNAGLHTCARCGDGFKSYVKTRRYCSEACYHTLRQERAGPKVFKARRAVALSPCVACGKPKPARQKFCSGRCYLDTRYPPLEIDCKHCGKRFRASPSNERQFCSYPCFVSDGGAVRAGTASAEAIMKKYGAKKDANHKEVMEVVRQFCAVHDLSAAGYGVPDGLAYVKEQWHLFDIKNPKTSYGRRGLNDRQKKWMSDWRGGPVYLIHNIEEAQRFAKGDFDDLKRQESGWTDDFLDGFPEVVARARARIA